ncbi:MAG TPA: co-chaperone DjlA [Thiotrichales bacterium]|nr:co-chaperone DjlA [Thiotrichales bacterium]
MGWWGKIIGGAFGFALGGPLGAMLGAALGHNFDRGLDGVMKEPPPGAGVDPERLQGAFFSAVFSLMGHLAKADGRVSPDEIAMAEGVMAQMHLSAEQRRAAIHLFNEGKRADFPLEEVVAQFRREARGRRTLMQMLLEILIGTALADGDLSPPEHEALWRIAEGLGWRRPLFEQLVAMVQAQRFYGHAAAGEAGGGGMEALEQAYALLGISSDAGDAEVKRAYRRLMSQHHPDKLVARGLPEEMLEVAKEKTQEIRAAYDRIKEARGMR